MKPQRKVDEKQLRQAIQAMPAETAKTVRDACKQHGLLPGGGDDDRDDKPDKDDKPKEKRP
jgi:hypothetical protein